MKKYYLHDGVNQQGPFELNELKSRNISKETPIWYDGLSEWTIAEKVDDLKVLFKATPPQFKNTSETNTINFKEEKKEPIAAKNEKKDRRFALYLRIFIILIVLGTFGYLMNQNSKGGQYNYSSTNNSYEEKVMSVDEMERAEPIKFLSVAGNYNLNFWGDKIKLHTEIINKATVATYKDVVIRVTYLSKTKSVLGTKDYTIYEVFIPNSQKHIELKIDNYKDVKSIACDVVGAMSN